MSDGRRYVAAAFGARPFGMKIPPNLLGLAAFGLLGALVSPGFWLIGAGLEVLYLWGLSRNARFRAIVDSERQPEQAWQSDYDALAARLESRSLDLQHEMERQGAELAEVLERQGASASQLGDVRQLVWTHFRLLAARDGLASVAQTAERDRETLVGQEAQLVERLDGTDLAEELRRSLTQQLEVIRSRRRAHSDAQQRRELVEAELERLRQQIALVREQALLATDEAALARSVDAISASLNEANRWLKEQQELFGGVDALTSPPPRGILLPRTRKSAESKGRQLE